MSLGLSSHIETFRGTGTIPIKNIFVWTGTIHMLKKNTDYTTSQVLLKGLYCRTINIYIHL